MLVVGSMVGSGIFIVSADIARQVKSPGLLLLVWLVTAFMTVIAASYYGELAAAMPHSGGQYVYLRESFGLLCGFLYGWSMLRFSNSKLSPSAPASFSSRRASVRDFSISRQKPATSCSS